MKKVGIITFHFCENYGALLQCYALKKAINKIEDCEAEVINYCPWEDSNTYSDKNVLARFKEKVKLFDDFRKNQLSINKSKLYHMDIENSPQYDYYVAGSDQIWNPKYTNFNGAYFLDFAPQKATRISYAASVGLDINDARLDSEAFKRYIPNFDYISIRENTHKKFIQQFTEKKVSVVLDPTLLLTADEYNSIEAKRKYVEGKFILIYLFSLEPAVIDYANMLSKKYNLKIVHFYADLSQRYFNNEAFSFAFDGPKDFIWYFKNAEFILTSTFYGTIFSIIFNKPFYVFNLGKPESRIVDLLEMLNLRNRMIDGYLKLSEIDTNIDYSSVMKILDEEREKSMIFLRNALK